MCALFPSFIILTLARSPGGWHHQDVGCHHPHRVGQQRDHDGAVHLQEEDRWCQHHQPEEDLGEAGSCRQGHCCCWEPTGTSVVDEQNILGVHYADKLILQLVYPSTLVSPSWRTATLVSWWVQHWNFPAIVGVCRSDQTLGSCWTHSHWKPKKKEHVWRQKRNISSLGRLCGRQPPICPACCPQVRQV